MNHPCMQKKRLATMVENEYILTKLLLELLSPYSALCSSCGTAKSKVHYSHVYGQKLFFMIHFVTAKVVAPMLATEIGIADSDNWTITSIAVLSSHYEYLAALCMEHSHTSSFSPRYSLLIINFKISIRYILRRPEGSHKTAL